MVVFADLNTNHACENCKKELKLQHWTGRYKDLGLPLHEITRAFCNKWLKSDGWLERYTGLFVKEVHGTICYVDFRGKTMPTLYAYDKNGKVEWDKFPLELKKVRKELLPYIERPTAKEIVTRRSRPDQIASVQYVDDPEELQALIDILTEKGIDVLEVLRNLDKSESINNESDINIPKCPLCKSTNFSRVKNDEGFAERCHDCGYSEVILGGDMDAQESGRGNGSPRNRDEKRPQNVDSAFF